MNSIAGDAVPQPPIASQASPPLPQLEPEPTSGATLFDLETARRRGLRHRGALKTGAAEIDEDVLLGGFERGQVVGVSAEEGELGVLVSCLFAFFEVVVQDMGSRQAGRPGK